ncbi:MAG: hypothetical protein OSB41_00385 [Kiritimatiellae bacterium]|nr:hypothetical protein [Kiritimatiellia bacterium]
MKLRILNPKDTIFSGDVKSVFVQGDRGEFEILDYHAPIVSLLRKGEITVDGKTRFPVKKGIVKFFKDECLVLLD